MLGWWVGGAVAWVGWGPRCIFVSMGIQPMCCCVCVCVWLHTPVLLPAACVALTAHFLHVCVAVCCSCHCLPHPLPVRCSPLLAAVDGTILHVQLHVCGCAAIPLTCLCQTLQHCVCAVMCSCAVVQSQLLCMLVVLAVPWLPVIPWPGEQHVKVVLLGVMYEKRPQTVEGGRACGAWSTTE